MGRLHAKCNVRSMNVGVLSDTHGWIHPQVQAVLKGADCIVHAGDVLGMGVLDALARLARKGRVVAVAGNNDRYDGMRQKAELPTVAEMPLPGGTLVVTHGDQFGSAPKHATLRQAWPQARAIVYGHTHRLVCDQDHEPWVLNPGAAGRTRTHGGASCLMLAADAEGWTVQAHRFPPCAGGIEG